MYKVKEKRTSLYYGVRVDKRIKNDVETIWYRSSIEAENVKYYLGAYSNEQHAGYAFNVGFNILSNGNYLIENKVHLNQDEMNHIKQKVVNLINKKIK